MSTYARRAAQTDGPYLAPGFVDVHVHGWGGHDAMGDGAALDGMSRALLRHGVTSFPADRRHRTDRRACRVRRPGARVGTDFPGRRRAAAWLQSRGTVPGADQTRGARSGVPGRPDRGDARQLSPSHRELSADHDRARASRCARAHRWLMLAWRGRLGGSLGRDLRARLAPGIRPGHDPRRICSTR